jgi:hypothetical protein
MNVRRLAALVGTVAICGVLAYRAGSPAPAAEAKQESFGVRYARAQLGLAEATLRKAQDMNRKIAETIPTAMVAQFTDEVEAAKAQLQSAQRGDDDATFDGWVRQAEFTAQAAETRLKNATQIERRAPGTFVPMDIERFRFSAEIAKLQFERGRSLAKAPLEAKLQWQVDMLHDEMAGLKSRTSIIGQNRGPSGF